VDVAPGLNAAQPSLCSQPSPGSFPLARVHSQVSTNCSAFSDAGGDDDHAEADGGGLFGSESEDSTADIAPAKRQKSVDLPLWELEDACNRDAASSSRLGDFLFSAELCSAAVQQPAAHSADQFSDECLSLIVREAMTNPGGICAELSSRLCGFSASTGTVENAIQVRLRDSASLPEESREQLRRIMSHIVDLPIDISDDAKQPAHKRSKVTCEAPPMACDVAELEDLLDELCREKAELLAKESSDHQTWRENTLQVLRMKKAYTLSAASRIRETAAASRSLTSRDRWLLESRVCSDVENMELLGWAKQVSQSWWALPESERGRYRQATQEDRDARKALEGVKELKDWVDEVDVFLGSLDPCLVCGVWDPWIQACKWRQCKLRVCSSCTETGCCSTHCAERFRGLAAC